MGKCLGDSEQLLEPSRLITALTRDYTKTIDNLRIQRLMGINRTDGKATAGNIPSKKDRSMFSCERYQFFLDAPFEICHLCCNVMKKAPMNAYAKETGRVPITGQMAVESRLRTQIWIQQGCNAFDVKKPISNPMAFWTEQDVLLYIRTRNIPICSVYGKVVTDDEEDGQLNFNDMAGMELFDLGNVPLHTTGCDRTGCIFCGFGCHLEKPGKGRFERLKITHPTIYEYVFRDWEHGGLGYKKVIDWINEHGDLHIRY